MSIGRDRLRGESILNTKVSAIHSIDSAMGYSRTLPSHRLSIPNFSPSQSESEGSKNTVPLPSSKRDPGYQKENSKI